jgi:hypothetical protein
MNTNGVDTLTKSCAASSANVKKEVLLNNFIKTAKKITIINSIEHGAVPKLCRMERICSLLFGQKIRK